MVQKLDSLLKIRGIKQAAFERSVMLSENRISKWKNGQGEPSATEALRMARSLQVPVEWLIDDARDEPAPTEFGEWERSVIALIDALGLEKQEVLRRLATAPPVPARRVDDPEPLSDEQLARRFPPPGPYIPPGAPTYNKPETPRKKRPG